MEDTREFRIISSLSQPNASAPAAVQQLLHLTFTAATSAATLQSDTLGEHLNNTFGSVMEVAAQTPPSQQGALVEFIQRLQQEKVVDPTTGQQLRYEEDYNKAVWSEVPNFGITVADGWNFEPADPSPDPAEVSRYENQVTFLAQLTNSPANTVPNPENEPGPFDFSLYALWELRGAFEATEEPRAPTTTYLRSVCYWVMYAADRLWANVQAKRDFRHKASNSNPAEAGDAYHKKKNWVGFNRERWDIWMQGLENARDGADEATRGLVDKALKEVERVMDQSWRIREEEKFV